MKKEVIAPPLLPFTDDEETALSDRLHAMKATALEHYVESARLALGNKALDKSWRPRIQFGLERAEAALSSLPPDEPEPVAAAAEPVVKVSKAKKAAAAKAAEAEKAADATEADEAEKTTEA